MRMPERSRAALALWVLFAGFSSAAAAGGEPAVPSAPKAAAAALPPAVECAAALAARVQAHYDRMRDLEAHFRQRTVSALSPAGDVSTGRVVLAKPGRMRWSYETPEPSLVVSDGATLWIFDPAAREVQELAVGDEFMSGAALQFLLGKGRIADSFSVSADRCDAARARLVLRPRAAASYERLELEVDARSGEAQSTLVVDLFGNRTEVEFSELRYDVGPDASVFRFDAPPGVRVLKLEPSAQ
jgi:outer membrane lipoprotein carrier protein